MNLLPLQIILGFQVAAAVVIFIQLIKGDDAGERRRAATQRIAGRTFDNEI